MKNILIQPDLGDAMRANLDTAPLYGLTLVYHSHQMWLAETKLPRSPQFEGQDMSQEPPFVYAFAMAETPEEATLRLMKRISKD